MQLLSIFNLKGDQMYYTVMVLIPVVFGLFAIAILFIRSIYKLYLSAQPEHRTIEPIMTWLLILPIFNFVWIFVALKSIQQLLYQELRIRNLPFKGDRLYNIGLVLGISNVFVLIPYINWVSIPLSFILFFYYWSQIVKYRKLLESVEPDLSIVAQFD